MVREDDAFSVTLLDFEDRADLGPDRRSHWAGARVRFCWRKAVTDDDARPVPSIDVTWASWSVVDAAEGRTTAGPVKGAPVPDWRTPVYPRSAADATLRPGECVAGWMGFAALDEQEIRYVRYATRKGGPTM